MYRAEDRSCYIFVLDMFVDLVAAGLNHQRASQVHYSVVLEFRLPRLYVKRASASTITTAYRS